jgi:hypothetical protein
VNAPGGAASILACIVAFACCQLKGFEIEPPSQPPSLTSPCAVPEGDSSKGANTRNDYSSHNDPSLSDLRHSVQTTGSSRGAKWTPENCAFSSFDKFGIGERVLDTSVRGMLFAVQPYILTSMAID